MRQTRKTQQRYDATCPDTTTARTPLLTVDEACRFLKIGRRTLERLIASRDLPAYKVSGQVGKTGGSTRLAQEDLDYYLSTRAR
jgi:excisionase family DNA binding protein